jgi:hypothetical protein
MLAGQHAIRRADEHLEKLRFGAAEADDVAPR